MALRNAPVELSGARLQPLCSAFSWKQFAWTALKSLAMSAKQAAVDLVVSLKNSAFEWKEFAWTAFKSSLTFIKTFIFETAVKTTQWILKITAVHALSPRIAWKLVKDVSKSVARKAARSLPADVYIFKVFKTSIGGYSLGFAAIWIVEVGIEIGLYIYSMVSGKGEDDVMKRRERLKLLLKKVGAITVRCISSLLFAAIGAAIFAAMVLPFGAGIFTIVIPLGAGIIIPIVLPSIFETIGCLAGTWVGPIVVEFLLKKVFGVDLDF